MPHPKRTFSGKISFHFSLPAEMIKATGKIKAAVLSGLAWNTTFFGQTFTSGGYAWTINESATPGTTTYQVVNHPTFGTDLGVTYQASGLPLQRVSAGNEVAGKYSVNTATGTYTIAAADEVALFFTYTYTVATGQSIVVMNQSLGTTPTFQLDYYANVNQPSAKPCGPPPSLPSRPCRLHGDSLAPR